MKAEELFRNVPASINGFISPSPACRTTWRLRPTPKRALSKTPLMSFARDMAAGFGDNDATQAPSEIGGQDR